MRENERVLSEMRQYMTPYGCGLFSYKPDDTSDPPGDLEGSGSFIWYNGQHLALTCHHVEHDAAEKGLLMAIAATGEGKGVSVNGQFFGAKLPIDATVTRIKSQDWNAHFTSALCVPQSDFAVKHKPVPQEALCIFGLPADDARAFSGLHVAEGLSLLIDECPPPSGLADAVPAFNPKYHFCMPYTPEAVTPVLGETGVLPKAPGLSGSLVWNTRYKEVSEIGKIWTPADARVTGLLWGWHTGSGVLIATRIEHVVKFLSSASG